MRTNASNCSSSSQVTILSNSFFVIFETYWRILFNVSNSYTEEAVTKDEEGNFYFNYKVAGRINIGTIQTYLTKSGNTLDVTYDVSKLIKLIEKVGTYTGNSTVKGISSLLNGYDGVTAGFKMKKVETSTSKK